MMSWTAVNAPGSYDWARTNYYSAYSCEPSKHNCSRAVGLNGLGLGLLGRMMNLDFGPYSDEFVYD